MVSKADSKKQKVTAAKKTQIVLRLLSGETTAKLSKETGITARELAKWKDDFIAQGARAMADGAPSDAGSIGAATNGGRSSRSRPVESSIMSGEWAVLSDEYLRVDKMAVELSELARLILEAATNLSINSTQTAAAVTETTTIVEEVRQTVEVSSRKAQNVSSDAKTVLRTSENGQKAANDVLTGMQAIKEHMDSLTRTILTLRNQTKQVGEIIATVDDIAQQSNLLAVNAAIEAARAGEQGKGFAVVAQAIKSLADQSKKATSNVRSILNEIVEATASATMKTEHGSKVVADGEGYAKQAGNAMVTLAESITRSAQAAIAIEASSQQQLQGVHQVLEAMKSVEEASNENQKGAKELETAVFRLHELGGALKTMTEELHHSVSDRGSR
jgi:Methyl-accepting chemotaxis protein